MSDIADKPVAGEGDNNEQTTKEPVEEERKVGSLYTIFSVWNTMIGSSTVSMPKAVGKAGIIPTIILNMIFCSIATYTANIVIKTGIKDKDFGDTIFRYFGRKKLGKIGRTVQIMFNMAINIGAAFIYFIIINQNLYPCLAFFINKIFKTHLKEQSLDIDFKCFSIVYCGLIVSIATFPLLIVKDMSRIVKLNSFGVYFISVLLIFEVVEGIVSLSNTHFEFKYKENPVKYEGVKYLYLFGDDVCNLAGVLSLGFFSHSFVIPVMRSNKDKSKNTRNLIFGYILVMLTYCVIGTMGYIGFSGKVFHGDFEDNWFRFFSADNVPIIILRLINVVQLLSIFPMIFSLVRIQLFGTFWKNEYPSKTHVMIYSASLLVLCMIILIVCADKLLKLMGYIGATCAMILVYTMPILVNMIYYKRKHPENLDELNNTGKMPILSADENENSQGEGEIKNDLENKQAQEDIEHKDDPDYYGISKKPKNKIKEIAFYILQGFIICIGVFVFIIQFKKINFFGIHIEKRPKF